MTLEGLIVLSYMRTLEFEAPHPYIVYKTLLIYISSSLRIYSGSSVLRILLKNGNPLQASSSSTFREAAPLTPPDDDNAAAAVTGSGIPHRDNRKRQGNSNNINNNE